MAKRSPIDDSIKYKVVENKKHKLCIECKEYFPMTNEYFYNNKTSKKDGLNSYCIPCVFKRARKWVDDNPLKYAAQNKRKVENRTEEQKEYIRNYKRREGYYKEWRSKEENKKKLKMYNFKKRNSKHDITKEEWNHCKEYFNYQCAYCGISEEEAKEIMGNVLHKEHVQHDGANDLSNCIPACKSCNSQKWIFEFDEWYSLSNETFSVDKKDKIIKWLTADYKLYKEIIQ